MARKTHLLTPKWVTVRTAGDKPLREGICAGHPNSDVMRLAGIDITSELQTHSLQARRSVPGCSSCERRLLPGEVLHVYESGHTLCTLCAGLMTEAPLRRERIHAAEVRLAVVPRAA